MNLKIIKNKIYNILANFKLYKRDKHKNVESYIRNNKCKNIQLYKWIDRHKNIAFNKNLYDGYVRIGFKKYYYKFDLMDKPFTYVKCGKSIEEPRYYLYINGIICKMHISKYSEFKLKELLKKTRLDYYDLINKDIKEKEVKRK